MDYEKKYKEALERARQKLHYPGHPCFVRVDEIFPELAESEDVRIKKTLIAFFRDWEITKSHCWNVNVSAILAWLEKQCHMLDPDKVIEWLEEHVPTKFEDMANYVQQFKEDFGL